MREKISAHVDMLFREAPQTKRTIDAKEEMKTNLYEKYGDLLAQGYNEPDAYHIVISGIGDISELINELKEEEKKSADPVYYAYQAELYNAWQKRNALVVSMCVLMYVLAIVAAVLISEINDNYGGLAFLSIAGISTVILIYHFMTRPKMFVPGTEGSPANRLSFKPQEESMPINTKRLCNSIISLMWTLTVVIYFLISFIFGIWHISWIIFLIAAAVTQIIKLTFELGDRK